MQNIIVIINVVMQRPQWISDLSVQNVKTLLVCRGLSSQAGSPYLHTALVHTEAQMLACAPPTPPTHSQCPALPLNFALRCLVGCRTRLCCVSGGNASPLSTEQLFDDGPCCTSLWFQSLQRAGLHIGLACSHNGHKSQGSGLHRPHTLAYWQWQVFSNFKIGCI